MNQLKRRRITGTCDKKTIKKKTMTTQLNIEQ
jgi:hypothetical protein